MSLLVSHGPPSRLVAGGLAPATLCLSEIHLWRRPRRERVPSSIALDGNGSDMPRYFFHVKRGQVTVLDQQGIELAGLSEATAEALERGRQIAASATLRAIPANYGAIVIDEELHTVQEVPFGDIERAALK